MAGLIILATLIVLVFVFRACRSGSQPPGETLEESSYRTDAFSVPAEGTIIGLDLVAGRRHLVLNESLRESDKARESSSSEAA